MSSGSQGQAMATGSTTSASPVSLHASIDVQRGDLKVRLRIVNQGEAVIYLFNRLWDLDRSGKPIPDPERIYRFVQDGNLRLLLGMAPLPRSKTPLYRNVPYVTRLEARESFEEDLTIPAPAKEHNVYFPVPAEGEYQPVPVKSVELLVQYVVATAAIETRASSFDTKALQLATPAAWDAAKTLRSAPVPLALQVMRRTGEFERLTLPGEKPEPPFPK